MSPKIILYVMMGIQMLAWSWHQCRAGQLSNRNYLIFCVMMMIGQTGAGIECRIEESWGTLVVQIFFFAFTGVGAVQRFRQMKRGYV